MRPNGRRASCESKPRSVPPNGSPRLTGQPRTGCRPLSRRLRRSWRMPELEPSRQGTRRWRLWERRTPRRTSAYARAINCVRRGTKAREQAAGVIAQTKEQVGQMLARAQGEADGTLMDAREYAGQELSGAREEASRILEEAQRQAEKTMLAARETSARMLASAEEQVAQTLTGGEQQSEAQRTEAQQKANELRARARADAREIVTEAHEIACEVVRGGTEASRNLRALSASLRNNAERLLRGVRLTHGSMTARLDQAAPGGSSGETDHESALPRSRRAAHKEPESDLDVPEFIPRG